MLQISAHSKILLVVQSIDFRKGMDSLAALCRQTLAQDPMSGILFVFRNRLQTSIRFLCFDGQGFWLFTKRLSSGRFTWWPKSLDAGLTPMDHKALYTLIYNGDPSGAHFAKDWKPLRF